MRAALGLPAVSYGLGEWTAAQARAAVGLAVRGLGVVDAVFVAAVLDGLAVTREEDEKLLRERLAEEAGLAERMAGRRLRATAARTLPSAGVLDRVVRQEGHLGRQLELTLRQLERLRAVRKPGIRYGSV